MGKNVTKLHSQEMSKSEFKSDCLTPDSAFTAASATSESPKERMNAEARPVVSSLWLQRLRAELVYTTESSSMSKPWLNKTLFHTQAGHSCIPPWHTGSLFRCKAKTKVDVSSNWPSPPGAMWQDDYGRDLATGWRCVRDYRNSLQVPWCLLLEETEWPWCSSNILTWAQTLHEFCSFS